MELDYFLDKIISVSVQHQHFYHFTDRKNIQSIKANHLLSMRKARDLNIQVSAPGGNDLSLSEDRRTGMDGYVHLCMTNNHPMAYVAQQDGRIEDIVWIKINPCVIKLSGVMVTNVVSNSSGCIPMPATKINDLDLQVLYERTDWRDPEINGRLRIAEKYEVLVPSHIDLNQLVIP